MTTKTKKNNVTKLGVKKKPVAKKTEPEVDEIAAALKRFKKYQKNYRNVILIGLTDDGPVCHTSPQPILRALGALEYTKSVMAVENINLNVILTKQVAGSEKKDE